MFGIAERLALRLVPAVAVRIIPKPMFTGRLGATDQLFSCVGDYEDVRGCAVGEIRRRFYGLETPPWPGSMGAPRLPRRWRKVANCHSWESATAVAECDHFYVVQLDLTASPAETDVFPGTWKSVAYILEDPERMHVALHLHRQFIAAIGTPLLHGTGEKKDVDFYDATFPPAGVDLAAVTSGALDWYYHVAANSGLADTLLNLFGLDNRCWHGLGYVGVDGSILCRVFLVRNILLSAAPVCYCRLMRVDEVLE